jgi:hypothetical protein
LKPSEDYSSVNVAARCPQIHSALPIENFCTIKPVPTSPTSSAAFQRAAALLRIASALPPDDPRVPVYQRLAAINAQNGFRKIGATYAVLYMQAAITKSKVPTP